MTATAVLLSVLVMAAVAGLVRELRRDGYGHNPPPRSRWDEQESRTLQLARLSR